ncbi:hypothetical protein ML462_13555 [Gramella lutea]|uniref:Uncharacterized protein n=1 Tax=Christiangramia lutea TaxID=1607951 RepID=A0A9X2AA13_9FLAO|nr:hypothetical protein [Christiangramia lutea]MCH4824199.1 hypothetical protein [Christiangramia lutea]
MAGITITKVDFTASPATIPCPPSNPNTKFTVSVTVKGQGGQLPGAYDVKLYDLDKTPNKTLLDEKLDVAVEAHHEFEKTHTFKLWCDNNCNVEGRLGKSGEKKPQLRAIVYYQDNLTKNSPVRTIIQCGSGGTKPEDKRRRE